MATEEAYREVYESLMEVPIVNGTYDAKHGSESFMHGVALVMESIACRAGMEEDFGRFWRNVERSMAR